METTKQTSKEYFTVLSIIHSGLLIGQLLFLVVFYYLVSVEQFPTDESLNEILQIIVSVFILGGLIGSVAWTKFRLNSIIKNTDLKAKLSEYRIMLIIKYAILEAPSLFALVSYFLTGNNIFLVLSGIIIFYFAIIKPTRNKAAMDLQLSREEREQIISK